MRGKNTFTKSEHGGSGGFAPISGKVATTITSISNPHSESLDAFMKSNLEFRKDLVHILMFG
jgi:hypothetical protein